MDADCLLLVGPSVGGCIKLVTRDDIVPFSFLGSVCMITSQSRRVLHHTIKGSVLASKWMIGANFNSSAFKSSKGKNFQVSVCLLALLFPTYEASLREQRCDPARARATADLVWSKSCAMHGQIQPRATLHDYRIEQLDKMNMSSITTKNQPKNDFGAGIQWGGLACPERERRRRCCEAPVSASVYSNSHILSELSLPELSSTGSLGKKRRPITGPSWMS